MTSTIGHRAILTQGVKNARPDTGTRRALHQDMMTTKNKVPAVGTLVRPVGGRYRKGDRYETSEVLYRVVSNANLINVEAVDKTGLPYSEMRASLALVTSPSAGLGTGEKVLIDDRWRAWEVVS